MPAAARQTDPVEHSNALWGLLIGAVAGIAIGVALVAFGVATGGVGFFVGAALLGAATGEMLGSLDKTTEIFGGTITGMLTSGSGNTKINSLPAARATLDTTNCAGTPPLYLPSHVGKRIAMGSATVGINSQPAARIGDKLECGAKIQKGSDNVFIAGGTVQTLEIDSEVPGWIHGIMLVAGLALGLVTVGPIATLLGLGGGMLGSWGGVELAKMLGLGEDGQKILGFAGGMLGGIAGTKLGMTGRLGAANQWAKCKMGLEPIDMGSGRVVDRKVDLALPGLIAFEWTRYYSSAKNLEHASLGHGGWSHSYDQWVREEPNHTILHDEEGRDVYFPKVLAGQSAFHRSDRVTLRAFEDGSYTAYHHDSRTTRYFAPLAKGQELPEHAGRAMLRTIEDPHGNAIRLDYRNGSLHRMVDTAGRDIRVKSDARGNVLRVEVWVDEQLQTSLAYGYTPAGELARATDAAGCSEIYEYDAERRLAKKSLKNGVSFHYEYDRFTGWCCRSWGDGGLHEGRIEVDLDRRVTTLSGNDEPRVYHWNADGLVSREETPDGILIGTWEYDQDLYVVAESDGAGRTKRTEYDERGHRVREIDPAGNVTEWRYDGDLLHTTIGPNGLRTERKYDAHGKLSAVAHPSGERYSYTRDAKGRLLTIADDVRALLSLEYDQRHDVIAETDARGARTLFTHDGLGSTLTQTDSLGRTARAEYDAMGRSVAIHAMDGSVRRTTYDALGNPSVILDPLAQTTRLTHAGTGWLAVVEQPDGRTWKLKYTADEKLRRIENPRGEAHELEYDTAGRPVAERTFDGRLLRYSYTACGRIARVDYPDGSYRAFSYDTLGGLVREDSSDATLTYQRDRMGRLLGGTITKGGKEQVVLFERDSLGRPTAETQGEKTLRFAYDHLSRRTSRAMPDGQKTDYSYDALDGLTHIQHEGYMLSFDRDVLGRETRRAFANGRVTIDSSYDAQDRLIEQRASAPEPSGGVARVIAERTWQYDRLGRVTRTEDRRWGATSYEYSLGGDLLEARRRHPHEVFSYDAAGAVAGLLRRVGAANSTAPEAWEIAPGNVLTRTNEARFDHDRRGRRVRKTDSQGAVTEYVWDARDRLTDVRLPTGDLVSFTYDAFGRRVQKDVRSPSAPLPKVTEFVWDGDVLAADIDPERRTRTFVHEPGGFTPLLQSQDGRTYAYVNDHMGTPKELIDDRGEVAWAASHTAFGRVVDVHRPDGGPGVSSPFRLLGQYADDETGLACTRYRYFDAATARWLSPDPLGLVGGPDAFAWDGTPINTADPLGLAAKYTAAEGTTRVRHYTNRKGANAIEEEGVIRARDNNRVYVEPASNKPLSRVEAESKYQIKPGRGRDYVETDVPNSQLEWVDNPRYGTPELTVKGDVTLQNGTVVRRR